MTDTKSGTLREWRVGRHYGIHVYEGDRPVATFHDPADAERAVTAVNNWRRVITGDPTEPEPLAMQARELLVRNRELEATVRNAVTWMETGFPERATANLRRVLDGEPQP